MQRTQAWLAISPIIAAGVLAAHALAYRLTGTPAGLSHDYFDHTPQLLLVLALVGVIGAGIAAELRLPPAWPFPVVAIATFVAQEHLERFVHTGQLPWLLTSPVFVVGVLLQAPIALLAWAVAHRTLRAVADVRVRRPRISHALVGIAAPVSVEVAPVAARPLPPRGPPSVLRR